MPTTTGKATELITFTRASLATVTDRNGLIDWAPHNLLLASEQFDASGWGKVGTTVAANTVLAPNGTITADKIAEDTSTGIHNVAQTITTAAATYVFGAFLKKAERSFSMMFHSQTNAGVAINLDTGAVSTPVGISAPVSSSVTSFSDGWYLCTITVNATAASNVFGIYSMTSSSAYSYAGSLGSGIYTWGAHLYRSDLGGMQANASAYPMYNPTTPKNLLGYSEDFSNAAWIAASSLGGVNGVKTNNYGIAPDGTQTAARIQLDVSAGSATAQSQIYQSFVSLNGSVYTRSAWVKTNDGSTKTIMGFQAGGSTPSTLTVTGTWTRLSAVRTATGTSDFIQFLLIKGTTSDTADLLVWHPQVSDSTSLDPYSPVIGAAPSAAAYYGPRLDYDPSTLAAKGLLVEEARTNFQYPSIPASATGAWVAVNSGTQTTGQSSPDGGTNAVLVTSNGGIESGYRSQITHAINTTYTWSAYVKSNGARYAYIRAICVSGTLSADGAWFDITNGVTATKGTAITTSTITPVGNGWYRITATATTPGTITNNLWDLRTGNADATNTSVSGQGMYFYGSQVEIGSFATSYILNVNTVGGVTRSADVASVGTSQFPYSATEGTLVMAYDIIGNENGNGQSAQYLANFNAGVNDRVDLLAQGGGNGPIGYVIVGGATAVTISNASTPVAVNAIWKAALGLKSGDFAASRNGSTPTTITTAGALPNASEFGIGQATFGAHLNGHIRQITYIPRRLSNAELQQRST